MDEIMRARLMQRRSRGTNERLWHMIKYLLGSWYNLPRWYDSWLLCAYGVKHNTKTHILWTNFLMCTQKNNILHICTRETYSYICTWDISLKSWGNSCDCLISALENSLSTLARRCQIEKSHKKHQVKGHLSAWADVGATVPAT
jgi:hypothetical protein